MIQLARQVLIPAVAMGAGLGLVFLIGTGVRQSWSGDRDAVAEQFAEMSPAQQERMLNNAKTFDLLRATQPEEWSRINELHTAVTDDSELNNRLARFHDWWVTLESSERQRLRNDDGTFVSNWGEVVESIYSNHVASGSAITVSIHAPGSGRHQELPEVWRFTETNLETFLDSVIPTPIPAVLTDQLSALDNPEDRTLAKILWVLREFTPQRNGPGRADSQLISGESVQRAFVNHLAPPNLQLLIKRGVRQDYRREQGRTVFIAVQFMDAALQHHEEKFRERYLGDERERLVVLYEEQDREFQRKLMSQDSNAARQTLQNMLVKDLQQTNSAVAALARDLRLSLIHI